MMMPSHHCMNSHERGLFGIWACQVKLLLSFAVAVSGLAGYIAASQGLGREGIVFFLGIWILTCGCASLNNHQDRKWDAGFNRTRGRPLPRGYLNPLLALRVSASLISAGLILLAWEDLTVAGVGAVAAICYNGLYTPMKRKSPWALLPGVTCGMLPPLMGWTAAGGAVFDIRIGSLMMLMGVWQIPHFGLLALAHGEGGLGNGTASPFLVGFFPAQIERILMVWLTSFGALILCVPMVGLIQTPWIQAVAAAMTIPLSALFLWVFLQAGLKAHSGKLFGCLNFAVFACLVLMIVDRI